MTNTVKRVFTYIDDWQRSHKIVAFLYAVFKKYNEDEAGYKAAILTYYGFLSLFPLLLVAVSIAKLLAAHHVVAGERALDGVASYIPLIGQDILSHVHGIGASGVALAVGIGITFFGARGIADAFRAILDHVWGVPYAQRRGFPAAIIRSLLMITLGGVGLLLSAAATGGVLAVGHRPIFGVLSVAVAFGGVFATVYVVTRLGVSVRRTRKQLMQAALLIAVGAEVLQVVGGYILAHELRNLGSVYGTFAIVLGLLFWLYLEAQVVLYSLEIVVVCSFGLWPRSLQPPRTTADKRTTALYAARDAHND